MARDKGNFYEASDWFKEALQINQVLCHLLYCEYHNIRIESTLMSKALQHYLSYYLMFGAGSPGCLVPDREPSLGQTGMGSGSKEV